MRTGSIPSKEIRGKRLTAALLFLFVPSGLAGLIYQSIWSQYLGLTLGHAAYAQTLVLGIFMGGMALGAWLCSRIDWSARKLLLGYAVVEAAIAVAGLLFHPLFEAYTGFSQQHVLPLLSGSGITAVYQWASAGLLILPQCVLLGATFPLLSTGLLKAGVDGDGRILGGLYFCNSLGASAGALLATFMLLPALGLPGTVGFAGWINAMVALAAVLVARVLPTAANERGSDIEQGPLTPEQRTLARTMLIAASLTGATSFVYEIGWIRLLNQALGTTIHSFELMLAAFILGLAFGGLWVRKRDSLKIDALRLFGYAQIAMGIAALLSILVFAQSFRWMGWIQAAVDHGNEGYQLYSLATAAICLVVMFPAAFFAGMTLPLCTMVLLRRGVGSRAVGQVYAANTLGAIIGVFAMVHLLIPAMGVRNGVILAGVVDGVLGLYLLRLAGGRWVSIGVPAVATCLAMWIAVVGGRIDPRQQVAGVFRTGMVAMPDSVEVQTIVDGKTATVAAYGATDGYLSITTNGKPDAMLALDRSLEHTADEPTMVMAGLLPLVHHPDPKRVAVIGWGSGLTTHTLASSRKPQVIETIEIEPAMIEVARRFGSRVERAYSDPRSRIVVDDARTHFAALTEGYDVVVSEPSNPWVSGVANLFTVEFYRLVERHLNDDGVLVQWLQVYELDERLFATMLAALIEVFPDTRLYLTNTSDAILVAHKGKRSKPATDVFSEPELAGELRRLGLATPEELAARCVGGGRLLQVYVSQFGVEPHSDFMPTVSLLAPRTRFKGDEAGGLFSLAFTGLPVLDVLENRRPVPADRVSRDRRSLLVSSLHRAALVRDTLLRQDPEPLALIGDDVYAREAAILLSLSGRVLTDAQLPVWSDALANVADGVLGLLGAEEQVALWHQPGWVKDPVEQPPAVRDLLAMYHTTAQRDWPAALVLAEGLLDMPDGKIGDDAREQVFLIGQLAAIALGQPERAEALRKAHQESIEVNERMRPVHLVLRSEIQLSARKDVQLAPTDSCRF